MGQIVDRVEDKRDKEGKKESVRDRLKRVKHLDIKIAVLVLLVVIAVYFGVFVSPKQEVIVSNKEDIDFVSKLEDVLSSIDGVGRAKIILSYDEGTTIEIATKVEEVTKVDKDGTVSIIETKREPIIIRGSKGDNPIVLNKGEKGIKGVVVVAKGGENPKVKLRIIDAISTLLDIKSDKIKVYEME